jgi:hypothetical protein
LHNARTPEERADAERFLAELDALEKPADPPQAAEPEPVVPPPPPLPAQPPPVEPVEQVGDAKWSPMLGFVQPGEPAPPVRDEASGGGVSVPDTVDLGLSGVGVFAAGGVTKLNPINDGITDDETAMNVLEVGLILRAEFRTQTSLIAPWFDVGGWIAGGEREETEPASTELVMRVLGLRTQGRFGIDLQPAAFFAAGPLAGYRLDAYEANLERIEEPSNTAITDNSLESDSGILYGLHARLRTKETAASPPLLFLDPALTWRTGEHVSGTYGSIEIGLRGGSFVFSGFFERRLSASGKFGASDVSDLSQAFAKSMPIEQRLGISLGGMFDGRG